MVQAVVCVCVYGEELQTRMCFCRRGGLGLVKASERCKLCCMCVCVCVCMCDVDYEMLVQKR